jgi:hypothetical protein
MTSSIQVSTKRVEGWCHGRPFNQTFLRTRKKRKVEERQRQRQNKKSGRKKRNEEEKKEQKKGNTQELKGQLVAQFQWKRKLQITIKHRGREKDKKRDSRFRMLLFFVAYQKTSPA